jgi:signal transduction histidine kinase
VLSIVIWVVVACRALQFLRFLRNGVYTGVQLRVFCALFAGLVGLALLRNLPLTLRLWVLMGFGYLTAIALFAANGQYDGRVMIMLTVLPIFAGILGGHRSAMVAVGLSAGFLGGMVLGRQFIPLRLLTPLAAPGTPTAGPYANFFLWLVIFLPSMVLQDRFTTLVRRLLANETGLRIRLQAETAERRFLEEALIQTAEKERQSVGHELHDGACQQIFSAMLQFKVLEKSLAEGKPLDPERVSTITAMLDGSLGQVHDLARGLSPGAITGEALVPSLRDLARRTRETFELDCELEVGAEAVSVDPGAATHLYRIAQEAVVNAVKHGAPRKIELLLATLGGRLTLEVRNDGNPLVPAARDREGMGLRIMRYRSELMGGSFELLSPPDAGVTMRCSVPLGSA